MRQLLRRLLLGLVLLVVGSAMPAATPPQHELRRVVILYDERTELPGLAILDDAIERTLSAESGRQVEIYRESLDSLALRGG
jgi:hypothetical protein